MALSTTDLLQVNLEVNKLWTVSSLSTALHSRHPVHALLKPFIRVLSFVWNLKLKKNWIVFLLYMSPYSRHAMHALRNLLNNLVVLGWTSNCVPAAYTLQGPLLLNESNFYTTLESGPCCLWHCISGIVAQQSWKWLILCSFYPTWSHCRQVIFTPKKFYHYTENFAFWNNNQNQVPNRLMNFVIFSHDWLANFVIFL